MKQVVLNYRSGDLLLAEVPAPQVKPGGVLVRTMFSLVSAGTEMMKIGESQLSLLGKAKARPDQVKKVMQSVAQQGLLATYQKIDAQLDSWTPLGYALAGEVVEVGPGVDEFHKGQFVACGGNQFAFHAELNWIPKNLCVPIPEGVDLQSAAFTTLGAVAMQAFRQSEAVLGETAVVIGLGLVGQLLTQILAAASVTVVGIDLSPERCRLAERTGASIAGPPEGSEFVPLEAKLREATSGQGADHIFITAGGDSNQPTQIAPRLARDRARVIDVGKTRLDLPWSDYYEKELDVRFSRSYGPGRYDPNYEERGIDYPIGYVRWTARRNMEGFLALIAAGKVDLGALSPSVYPFEQAIEVYRSISSGDERSVGVLFGYKPDRPLQTRLTAPSVRKAVETGSRVALAVLGAGNYASSMLLPRLGKDPRVRLVDVVTTTSLSAANAQRRFSFEKYGTDLGSVLADPETNAVLIATRHSSHAELVCQALAAGKAVFVEKPLAINRQELEAIVDTVRVTGNDRLMVGFNRRFAPLLGAMRKSWTTAGPVHMRYAINAGPLENGSWYADPSQGGRFVGEAGHFIDTVSWWIGEDPVLASAVATENDSDNLAATFVYPGGSLATISYLTDGHPRFPKETIEVFGQRRVARFENFRSYEIWTGGRRDKVNRRLVDKGQAAELDAFVKSILHAGPMPISFDSLVLTAAATIAAQESAQTGQAVVISGPPGHSLEEPVEQAQHDLPVAVGKTAGNG